MRVVGLNEEGERVSVFGSGVGFGEEFVVELSSAADDDLAAVGEEVVGGVPAVGRGEFEPIAGDKGGGTGEKVLTFFSSSRRQQGWGMGGTTFIFQKRGCLRGVGKRERRCYG